MTRLKNLFSRGARDETSEEELAFTREAPLNYDRDPFLHSLAELKPEDIPLSCPPGAQSRREKMKRILSDVAMYVCVAVFLVSCVLLVDNLLQKQKGSALYDEVAAEFSAAGAFELGEETAADDGTVRDGTDVHGRRGDHDFRKCGHAQRDRTGIYGGAADAGSPRSVRQI